MQPNEASVQARPKAKTEIPSFDVHDIIRVTNYPTAHNKYRLWKVAAVRLGGAYKESYYELKPLDVDDENVIIPCIILERIANVEKI